MRYLHFLLWPLKFILFAVLFAFAMHNAEMVPLSFFLGYVWNAPLALLLLIFFILGASFGLLACLARLARLRREVVTLRRELRNRNPATRPVISDVPHDAF
ncbi:MAG: lipopolysaccharide assembly protein LapA domain-containing protein [Formivibrio sp.]|nr:lipopolysaccharide assembly protein LapA domain-containing protein [Formivibrio sp.]